MLKQFDDYLVKVGRCFTGNKSRGNDAQLRSAPQILIAAAAVDFVIALLNGETGAACVTIPQIELISLATVSEPLPQAGLLWSPSSSFSSWLQMVCSYPGSAVLNLWNVTIRGMMHAATVGVVTETNAEKAIEELKAYEVRPAQQCLWPIWNEAWTFHLLVPLPKPFLKD